MTDLYFLFRSRFIARHKYQSSKYLVGPESVAKFPLAAIGVLDPGSVHARPSARPPIDTRGHFKAHMSGGAPDMCLKVLLLATISFEYQSSQYLVGPESVAKFRLAPIGVLTPRSAHARPLKIIEMENTSSTNKNINLNWLWHNNKST